MSVDPALTYWTAAPARGRAWLANPDEVASAIDRGGAWTTDFEWRISTLTRVRIERASSSPWPANVKPPDARPGFDVTVACGFEARCWSPTIERALDWAGVFVVAQQDTFTALGWPSWSSKSEL